jgi:hypothetical protein
MRRISGYAFGQSRRSSAAQSAVCIGKREERRAVNTIDRTGDEACFEDRNIWRSIDRRRIEFATRTTDRRNLARRLSSMIVQIRCSNAECKYYQRKRKCACSDSSMCCSALHRIRATERKIVGFRAPGYTGGSKSAVTRALQRARRRPCVKCRSVDRPTS